MVSTVGSWKTAWQDTGAHNGRWWRNALGINVTSAQGTNEVRPIAEPNSAYKMHQVLMKSKLQRRQAHATSVEDPISNANVQVTATTNFKTKQQHKLTKPTTQINFATTKQATICFQWEHLFQASQQITSSTDMLVSTDTNKCFLGTIGERYSFKKPGSQHENTTSSESSVHEVIEAVMACKDDPSTQDPVCNVTDADSLMELFDQFSGLMLPMLGWLEPDTAVISEASLEGKSATYQVTIQNVVTSALLDSEANISFFFSERFSGNYHKHLNW